MLNCIRHLEGRLETLHALKALFWRLGFFSSTDHKERIERVPFRLSSSPNGLLGHNLFNWRVVAEVDLFPPPHIATQKKMYEMVSIVALEGFSIYLPFIHWTLFHQPSPSACKNTFLKVSLDFLLFGVSRLSQRKGIFRFRFGSRTDAPKDCLQYPFQSHVPFFMQPVPVCWAASYFTARSVK